MEETTAITNFCKTLASFCKHLQFKSNALKESVERRPIPLESATSTFTQCLNRRVSSTSTDLNLLESMAFGTVSFEELLGHCNELYKKNQSDLVELEDRFASFGYIPETVIDSEDDGSSALATPIGADSKIPTYEDGLDRPSFSYGPLASVDSIMKKLEQNPLFEESFSLQKLGLSDVCLATLASEDATKMKSAQNYNDVDLHRPKVQHYPGTRIVGMTGGKAEDMPKSVTDAKVAINVSKDDYESLPSFMKSLTSWEDLNVAVEKMNSTLCRQQEQKENLFYQDDLEALGLGPKVRSYLLLLLRMNRLVVETINGSIAYRVL